MSASAYFIFLSNFNGITIVAKYGRRLPPINPRLISDLPPVDTLTMFCEPLQFRI